MSKITSYQRRKIARGDYLPRMPKPCRAIPCPPWQTMELKVQLTEVLDQYMRMR